MYIKLFPGFGVRFETGEQFSFTLNNIGTGEVKDHTKAALAVLRSAGFLYFVAVIAITVAILR